MSEAYEGVVVRAGPDEVLTAFRALASGLRLRLVHLAQGCSGVYRVAGAAQPFAPVEVEVVASTLSRSLTRALAVFYDNGCGLRQAALFESGTAVRCYGDADELWVPLDDSGAPVSDAEPVPATAWLPGEEYDCCLSAIDAGLRALGVSAASSADLKQAFCYDDPQPTEESTPSSQRG